MLEEFIRELNEVSPTEGLVSLQEWLEMTGFTRGNFKVMLPSFRVEVDYFLIDNRYYINEENIRDRIIDIGDSWERIIKRGEKP